jgi:hypothetical protein
MSHSYSPLNNDTDNNNNNNNNVNKYSMDPCPRFPHETDEEYKARLNKHEWNNIFHSIIWSIAACFILYYSNFFIVLFYDKRVRPLFLNIGILALTGLIMVISYLAFWLPFSISRNTRNGENTQIIDYYTYSPRIVMMGVISCIIIYITFTIALWPIWGWVTLIILFVLSMAACLAPNFLPSCGGRKSKQ